MYSGLYERRPDTPFIFTNGRERKYNMAEQSLKEKTAKGLFWGGFSNGIQQLLNLLFGIIITRMLDSTDYGMIGMLAIFTAVANSIQESGFTAALANKQTFRHEDYNAVFWFSFLMGASLYLLLFFCAPFIAAFYKTPQLIPLSRFLFLGFLISSCGTAHNAVLFKKLMVKEKAKATITALLCSGTIGIVMAYNGMAFWGLAVQQITYIFIANALLWYFSPWRPTFSFNFKPIREMLPFSSKLLITNVFHYINDNIFSVLLGRFYTSQDVGYYTQANKWTNMGFSLISNMINGVSQPVLVETSSDAMRQKNIFRKMLRFTAFISFPAMFGLALIANEFIVIAVTAKWQACVPIMQILCIWGAFVPITYMYSNLLISKGKSNLFMWNTIAQSLVQLTMLLCTISQGILVMVVIYTVINIGWLLIWHYFVNKQIHITLWEVMKDITPYLLISGGVIGTSYFLTIGFHNLYVLLILKIGIAVSLYVFIMWIGKSVIFFESVQFIRKKLLK